MLTHSKTFFFAYLARGSMMTMMIISPHMSVSSLVFMEMIYSEDYTANTATNSATDDLKDFDDEDDDDFKDW